MPATSPTAAFAEKFAGKYGLDIAMIVAIISAIAKIFESCPKPPTTSEIKSPNIIQQVRATRAVMNELDGVSRREARRLAGDLLAAAAAEDDATIAAVCNECLSGTFS